MDSEASHAAVHGVAKSRTQLSDWTELMINIDVTENKQRENRYSDFEKQLSCLSVFIQSDNPLIEINAKDCLIFYLSISSNIWISS